jgi:hypothetical protein
MMGLLYTITSASHWHFFASADKRFSIFTFNIFTPLPEGHLEELSEGSLERVTIARL